ncbi:MAG TPA: outer membrane beta-barrel protein [Povalibacter sp.]|uniref:outer membrane beta-barrel protein n=1 Tax=Povalibacter sp. TaxID=1962978 RepID=UPI002C5002CF|nr:outer membrane beta-barrel protein [Povalibacter sp.]HMN47269.1 outer membrane beta-barrel protein [Povalibacter sp.]
MKAMMAAACCMLGTAAWGADSGFYFGVLGGASDYEFRSPSAPTAVLPQPVNSFAPDPSAWLTTVPPAVSAPIIGGAVAFLPIGWLPGDDSDGNAWGVTAGYRIVRYAAVELNYLNLGTLKESDTVFIYPIPSTTEFRRELETTGPTLSVLGTLPIVGGWSIYARVGVLFADMNLKSSIGAATGDTSFASRNMLWGAGTQFDWGDHWSVRLDFQRFESVGDVFQAGEADIDLLNLGVLFRL